MPSERNDAQSPTSIPEIIDQAYLDSAFGNKEGFMGLLKLRGEKAKAVINLIDTELSSDNLKDDLRKRYVAVLRKLCGNCLTLPKTRMLAQGLVRDGDIPQAGGGFTDLWKGKCNEKNVAIKVLRLHVLDDQSNVKKLFVKEAAVWCHMKHENILSFIGIRAEPDFCLVSPWMKHGNINKYVKNHPRANRLPLLKDVLEGLKYLHSLNIVHGDLKGGNILIKDNCRACLADFGLASLIADKIPGYYTSSLGGGTFRWMAPELLNFESSQNVNCTPTIESDIFGIGMLICEVISGQAPWYKDIKRNEQIISKIINGDRPPRPDDATSKYVKPLWPIAELCWQQIAKERPNLIQVMERLDDEIRNWSEDETQTEEYVDHDDGTDTDDEKQADELYATGQS